MSTNRMGAVVPEFERLGARVRAIADATRIEDTDVSRPHKSSSQARKDGYQQHHFAGEWSSQPVDNLQMEAVDFIARAEDHLRAMAVTVATPQVMFSVFTLGRTVLVSSAHAHYMLEPDIEARERMRRWLNLRSATLRERLLLTIDQSSPHIPKVNDQIDELRAAGKRFGFECKHRGDRFGGPPLYHFGKPFPSDTRLVTTLLDTGDDIGTFAFRWYSAAVHSQPNITAASHVEQLAASIEGIRTARRGMTLQAMARHVLTPVVGYWTAHRRVQEYFGRVDHDTNHAVDANVNAIARVAR